MTTKTAPSPLRVALQNVGCKLNTYEVEALANGFDRSGYEIVPFGAIADVYVVNTCTVTGSGDSDSRKAVGGGGCAARAAPIQMPPSWRRVATHSAAPAT
jgi:tRNA A37 methylthiotransferase MiaB